MKFMIYVLIVSLTFSVGFSKPAQAQFIPAGLIGWALGGLKGGALAVGGVALTRAFYRNREKPIVSNYYIVQQNVESPKIDYELLAKETADELERREQERAIVKLKQDNKEKFDSLISRLLGERNKISATLSDGENVCYALCGSYGSDGVLKAKSVISRSYDKEAGFDSLLNQCGNSSIVFWDLRDSSDGNGPSYQHLMLGNPEAVCRTNAPRASGQGQRNQTSRGQG